MHRTLLLIGLIAFVPAALADDAQPIIAKQLQALMDATSAGDARVWDALLDPACLYVEEDDSVHSKADMLKENVPLPKGISGAITVEVLRFHQDGDIVTAVSRDHETENYFGQILHAEYLSTSTWRKEAGGWKLIAAQVLAEPVDPPATTLPPSVLADYAGTYRLKDADATYVVAASRTAIYGGRSGRSPSVLNAEVKDVFFIAGQPRTRLIFTRDANGHVGGLVSRREGRDVVWEKE
ncbi:MAG: nuclear transport factor 2 family protein [Rhizomicrobium sp.]|jgi:ketosteroid isomerase-like protein